MEKFSRSDLIFLLEKLSNVWNFSSQQSTKLKWVKEMLKPLIDKTWRYFSRGAEKDELFYVLEWINIPFIQEKAFRKLLKEHPLDKKDLLYLLECVPFHLKLKIAKVLFHKQNLTEKEILKILEWVPQIKHKGLKILKEKKEVKEEKEEFLIDLKKFLDCI